MRIVETFGAAVVAMGLIACCSGAWAGPREVQVSMSDPMMSAIAPMQALAEALRRDKRSLRFRVTWIPGQWSYGTALYDRRRRTLKYFYFSEFREAEEPVTR